MRWSERPDRWRTRRAGLFAIQLVAKYPSGVAFNYPHFVAGSCPEPWCRCVSVSTAIPDQGRIDQAAKFAPLEQLALSPQCGFSSGIGGQTMSVDQEIRKLELIVETAREVWGSA